MHDTVTARDLKRPVEQPTTARIHDLLGGGRASFAIDRRWTATHFRAHPTLRQMAWRSRHYAATVVQRAAEAGITQFLDLGAGFRRSTPLDDIARHATPQARVVAVDHDVHVTLTWENDFISGRLPDAGLHYLRSDLREVDDLLHTIQTHGWLNPAEPVCILCIDVLHHHDAGTVATTLADYHHHMPAGSWLALTHLTTDKATGEHRTAITDLAAAYTQLGEHTEARTLPWLDAALSPWTIRERHALTALPPGPDRHREPPPDPHAGAVSWCVLAEKTQQHTLTQRTSDGASPDHADRLAGLPAADQQLSAPLRPRTHSHTADPLGPWTLQHPGAIRLRLWPLSTRTPTSPDGLAAQSWGATAQERSS
ncbi:SAM-dependent methyltransferase [Saccharothrix sp. AJ9571]|nr:SAM-dependent methyltransferase [Saccharothrix sp. AJ9571]